MPSLMLSMIAPRLTVNMSRRRRAANVKATMMVPAASPTAVVVNGCKGLNLKISRAHPSNAAIAANTTLPACQPYMPRERVSK